jgi:hypothetical protein
VNAADAIRAVAHWQTIIATSPMCSVDGFAILATAPLENWGTIWLAFFAPSNI